MFSMLLTVIGLCFGVIVIIGIFEVAIYLKSLDRIIDDDMFLVERRLNVR